MEAPFFAETLWSSSLKQSELPRARAFLASNGFRKVDVALTSPKGEDAVRMRWATFYDGTGQCVSLGHQTPIPIGSWFLKLTIAFSSAEERDARHTDSVLVANALRLMFGVPIARELVLERNYTQDMEGKRYFSDVGYASSFDNQNLNIFDEPPIEDAKLRPIPLDATMLLHKAFAQRYPPERFILMWLAFEALIHTHPGGGSNGEKRRRFFLQDLGSQIAADEVNWIRDIRNDAFKEGRLSGANLEEACWSLYAALQLAVLEECPQRRAYLEGYESYIKQKASR